MINLIITIRKHWKFISISLGLLIFLYITKLLLSNEISYFDNIVYSFITIKQNTFLDYFYIILSFFGSTSFIIFGTINLMIKTYHKKISLYIGLNVLICFLINQIIKIIFARLRPTNICMVLTTGYSFPSGHSMVSIAFYGMIVYLIRNTKYKKKTKITLSCLLLSVVILIGTSRIYLGAHYASDVLAGFALGLTYLTTYIKFFNKKLNRS